MRSVFFARRAGLLASVSCAMLLAGCVTPDPMTNAELKDRASQQLVEIQKDVAPIDHPLTLAEAIARASKYNLEHRVKMMEQVQAMDVLDVSRWDLLPKLTADAGYDSRSVPYATNLRNLYDGQSSLSQPTYGVSPQHWTDDLTLSWNILDFGVSYFNAKQNADRVLIASERRRKVMENLAQQVRSAWWRAAAAQKLKGAVEQTLTMANAAMADAKKSEDANIKNPIEVLRYERSLIESTRQIEVIEQELATAKTELSVLIGLTPGTPFTIAVPTDDELAAPQWSMPIGQMEDTALVDNPDLREQNYQERVSSKEVYKSLLKLLPGVTFGVSRNYDSNSLQINNYWNEATFKVTWNLFNLLSAPATIAAAESDEDVAHARLLATHMAVLAQVHVSRQQFAVAVKQFQQASDVYAIDQKILHHSQIQEANNAQSALDRISNNTTMIVGLLRRYQTLAQVHAALGRMQAAIGADPLPTQVAGYDIPTLTKAINAKLTAAERAPAETVADKPAAPAAVPAVSQAAPAPVAAAPTAAAQAPAPATVLASNDDGNDSDPARALVRKVLSVFQ